MAGFGPSGFRFRTGIKKPATCRARFGSLARHTADLHLSAGFRPPAEIDFGPDLELGFDSGSYVHGRPG